MRVHELTPTDRPTLARGDRCVVAVGSVTEHPEVLTALFDHTPAAVPIVLIGTAETAAREMWIAPSVDEALDWLAPADVALLMEPCLVGAGWLPRMAAAARADSNIASASALCDRGGPLAVGEGQAGVIAESLRLRPRLARAFGPCVYLRREALELVGGLDGFAQRCVLQGLSHVAADDVVVGRRSAAPDNASEAAASSVLPRALEAARRCRTPLSVTVDARGLGGAWSGTQVHVWRLIQALDETDELRLRVLVGPESSAEALARLRGLANAEVLPFQAIDARTPVTTIFHRPQQVFDPRDLELAFRLGQRLVVSQLDLIAYRNRGYFPSRAAWLSNRRVTRQAMAASDRVIVSSEHTAADLCSDELVGDDRLRIVAPGLDHGEPAAPRRPPMIGHDGASLLCLGADYSHKNRTFALRLLRSLVEDHGWTGRLLFAGEHVSEGSSRPQEHAYLAAHPELADRVLELGPVAEDEKAWLMSHVAAVVYPSVYEGFGLVPFECGRVGVPCLFAAQSSLADVLAPDVATLVPWDERRSAAAAVELLRPGPARSRHLAALRAAGEPLTWRAAAERTIKIYREAAVAPTRDAAALSRDEADREADLHALVDAQDALVAKLVAERTHAEAECARAMLAYQELRADVGSGLGLVGPSGSLPVDLQRALLALSAHPALSAPVYTSIGASFRLARALHRRLRRPG